MHLIHLVQQISRHHCFPACLVSYFSDLQLPLEQNEIVNQLPNLFFKGTKEEGAFTNSDENLKKVSKEFDIEIKTNFKDGEISIPDKSTLFFFLRWKNNPSDNHCVRFYKQENDDIYFMNPNSGKIENEKSKVFNSWVTKIILITKR